MPRAGTKKKKKCGGGGIFYGIVCNRCGKETDKTVVQMPRIVW